MSSIPDIRAEFIKPLYNSTEAGKEMTEHPKENAYYQGNLDEESANYLAGFDHAVDKTFENFLYNLDVYIDDLEECGFDDQRLHAFNEQLPDFLNREFYSDEPLDLETVKDSQIRLIFTLARKFWEWAEMDRDEIGTGLIESMGEEQLAECTMKRKAGYKNYLLRLEEEEEENEDSIVE